MLLLVMTVVHGIIANDMMTVLGCDNTSVTLSCPVGSYISLIRANYGRFSISVCNHYARDDIHTHCHSMEESTDILAKMCNKLSSCHVVVNSDVLPEVCPETPKYLEAQYQCRSYRHMEEEVRQTKLPELGGNISDVWSDRDMVLDREAVDEAIETVIKNNHIPITQKPEIIENATDDVNNHSVPISVNSVRSRTNVSNNISVEKKEGAILLSIPVEKSSLHENRLLDDSAWYMIDKEDIIIILISSICVTLVLLCVSIIIVKTYLARTPVQNIEMSATGSSAQSDCSLSTNTNSDHINNFQQRFHHFKPERESPHDGGMYRDIDQCDGNKNTITMLPSHPHCTGNIHINYNISYSHNYCNDISCHYQKTLTCDV